MLIVNLDEFEVETSEKKVKKPYIVSIDEGSGKVLSIYRNYNQDDDTE